MEFEKKEATHNGAEIYTMRCFCKQGINRSVACARVLWGVLDAMGYIVEEPIFLSLEQMRERRFCIDERMAKCPQCACGDGMDRDKTWAIEEAFRVWCRI